MNSLTTHYRRSQLIALPVPGGKAKVEYCYAVNVPGDREIVTHSFAEWAVGDFNRQKETVLCDKLTAGSKITTECPSESFVGSRKHNGLAAGKSRRYVARIYNVGLSTLYKRFPVTGIQTK